ncbi:M48 family metallopeptidase [Uliginosibacterium sp. H1]|uniref:M48 family metallopeptidase n=1 Tax=Uliginosibacterium sp. H1 TaxID=3114757 RepID=UPI002E16F048|nr:M48 family metallopeptidase [Uliginosibacterium sp. H1]
MKYIVALGSVLLGVAACQSVQTTNPGEVGVTRQQSVSPLVNRGQLTQQANTQYKQVLQQAQKKNALNVDAALTARVRRIADRIIPQVSVFRPEAAKWQWEVNVLSSKELNAWCMPGGKIAFYSGLIETLQLNDDEIAAIMGHEIAHALREHAWERASQAANAGLGMTVAGILLGAQGYQMDMASMAYQVMFELPNSREHETEADRIGVELAARAGYNPAAAVTLWQKMGKQSSGGEPPQFLSTHPANADRQKDLTVYSQRVQGLYEQARR